MILISLMIIQMSESEQASLNIIDQFNALKSNTNLETLDAFDKKTPTFTLKDTFKICKIVDVYDGDTIRGVFENNGVYNKWTIRMYGYDSPEIRPSRKLPNRDEIKAKARESRDYLREKVLNKTVFLHCLDFDKYGRVLANVYIDELGEISVNDHMVEMNYGYPYFGGTKK